MTAAVPEGGDARPTVRVEPSGLIFPIEPDETIIEAAWRADLVWPTQCWAQAQCGACVLRVAEGAQQTSEMSAEEQRTLDRYGWLAKDVDARLACRMRVHGDGVVVRKGGVHRGNPP